MKIIKKLSPNFTPGRKKYQPLAIVIHIMQGSLAGTDSWFANRQSKVSAHYGVGRSGEVHQFVEEKDTAWHAGVITNPSWSLIKKTGSGLYINPNYYTIGIEHEGTIDTEWTDAMYESTSALIAEISKRWNIPIDRNHIIGHHEIYAVKACPGNKVDFNKLIALASGAQPIQPPIITPSQTFPPINALAKGSLWVRKTPNRNFPPVNMLKHDEMFTYRGLTDKGEAISGNSTWLLTNEGYWVWSGGMGLRNIIVK